LQTVTGDDGLLKTMTFAPISHVILVLLGREEAARRRRPIQDSGAWAQEADRHNPKASDVSKVCPKRRSASIQLISLNNVRVAEMRSISARKTGSDLINLIDGDESAKYERASVLRLGVCFSIY
jgi:hypothetical protein